MEFVCARTREQNKLCVCRVYINCNRDIVITRRLGKNLTIKINFVCNVTSSSSTMYKKFDDNLAKRVTAIPRRFTYEFEHGISHNINV